MTDRPTHDPAVELEQLLGSSVSAAVTINALIRNDITSVEQLRKLTDQDLLGISNLGQGRIDHIRASLARTDISPKPDWMHFINFDGRVTGQTAQVIEEVAADRGLTPQQVIAELLHEAINGRGYGNPGRTEVDVKVEPMTINAGNGGFHVVTVVADGYGNLVAEDTAGTELARVANRPGATLADLIADLTRQVAANKANPHTD